MPNPGIFCNAPWYEIQIYWDGALGICCQEDHRLYGPESDYNIRDWSIQDWFNSEPVVRFREKMFGDRPLTECRRCYTEERTGRDSRRIRSNQKSVIYAQAFDASWSQSPGRGHFQSHGFTRTLPIDLHIDLGNHCNLTCKMCNPQASSRIAAQLVQWGHTENQRYLGSDWTRDPQVWRKFLDQLLAIPGLNNIHFMGGETLLTDRFHHLVDHLLTHGRTDVCLSFVTNGTRFDAELMSRLMAFRRVGIEVSIESTDATNAYQRQGTDTDQVLANIQRYQALSNGSNVTVTLRPAPSALTIGSYHTVLELALSQGLNIKSNLVYDPRFLAPEILPQHIREAYWSRYQSVQAAVGSVDPSLDYNASDPHNVAANVAFELRMVHSVLHAPDPEHSDQAQAELVAHCGKWDRVAGLDARIIYPEWRELLDRYGYPG